MLDAKCGRDGGDSVFRRRGIQRFSKELKERILVFLLQGTIPCGEIGKFARWGRL